MSIFCCDEWRMIIQLTREKLKKLQCYLHESNYSASSGRSTGSAKYACSSRSTCWWPSCGSWWRPSPGLPLFRSLPSAKCSSYCYFEIVGDDLDQSLFHYDGLQCHDCRLATLSGSCAHPLWCAAEWPWLICFDFRCGSSGWGAN